MLHSGGTVVIRGQLSVRNYVARCELGAQSGARLEIGERAFINQGASIVASESITIGDDARVGDFVAIYDSNFHSVDPHHPVKCAPVHIGDNVWLGRGAVVLPGTTIGDHSVVAAGSVVTGEVSSRVLIAGNPAQVVRQLEVPEGWRRR